MATTFQTGVRVKRLNTDIAPSIRIEPELQGAGTVGATAATTADGFFLMTVITTAGTTVAARVPFFTV